MARVREWLCALAAGFLGAAIAYFKGRREGVENEKAKQAEKALDMVEKSRQVDDRLASDASYRGRVRGRYSRRK
jgi:chemotaxis regulatin CheY-phosphate phosphatase CheZ